MPRFRAALLATADTALSLATTPGALASGLTFVNKTTANGLGNNRGNAVYASGSSWTTYTTANSDLGDDYVYDVYVDGSTLYAATDGGLSIAQLPAAAVPGPPPIAGAGTAFSFARRLRAAASAAES
jgi:hypothetical protein